MNILPIIFVTLILGIISSTNISARFGILILLFLIYGQVFLIYGHMVHGPDWDVSGYLQFEKERVERMENEK